MIKLKIGDNYLITSTRDELINTYVPFMMGCFFQHNCVAIAHPISTTTETVQEYIKAVKESGTTNFFLLVDDVCKKQISVRNYVSPMMKVFIDDLRASIPNIKIKVIDITNAQSSKEYKFCVELLYKLRLDPSSIAHHLKVIDRYKEFSTRYKAIPAELRVINSNIRKLSKETEICDRKIGLKDLEYLNLIKHAELVGSDLYLTLHKMAINPSEDLSKAYTTQCFKDNPYLFNAVKYIRQGCHFGMGETRIKIDTTFTPTFLETLDKSFDDMFDFNNWSKVGYLHFGVGHLCGGEFNGVISSAGKNGLEYYFIALKQYLGTANIRDYAGQKVWWYPIYNDEGELVYCAGLEILRDSLKNNYPEVKDMTIKEFLVWKKQKGILFRNSNIPSKYCSSSTSMSSSGTDNFLTACATIDPELCEKLKKGAK